MNTLSTKNNITIDEVSNSLLTFCKKIGSGWTVSSWEQPMFVYKSTKDVVLLEGEDFNSITFEQLLNKYVGHYWVNSRLH